MTIEEATIKHLELIQQTINRLATASFILKGWSVSLVAALFVLAQKDAFAPFAVAAIVPVLAFWGLDAYYLRQERLFRALYEAICNGINRDSGKQPPLFSMDTGQHETQTPTWFQTLSAPTIIGFHSVVAGATIVGALIIIYRA